MRRFVPLHFNPQRPSCFDRDWVSKLCSLFLQVCPRRMAVGGIASFYMTSNQANVD